MAFFADFRIKRELETIDILSNCTLTEREQVNPKFYKLFEYSVNVNIGIFKGRSFTFLINIYEDYPFRAPKVTCKEEIFHPNIDEKGNVCLNILREDWSCAMDLQSITLGLFTLFVEIKGEDALNTEAGDLLLTNPDEYIKKARKE